jgi:hypothetical protein
LQLTAGVRGGWRERKPFTVLNASMPVAVRAINSIDRRGYVAVSSSKKIPVPLEFFMRVPQ